VGICLVAIGIMALPFVGANPKAVTQSLFARIATTGAFTRPGLMLILVGAAVLGVAALLPSNRD